MTNETNIGMTDDERAFLIKLVIAFRALLPVVHNITIRFGNYEEKSYAAVYNDLGDLAIKAGFHD